MNKGQVTIFVALGLVILIVIGTATFLLTKQPSQKKLNIVESNEINNLITQCLNDLSKEAIKKIGLNGGYINPENLDLTNNLLYPTKNNFLSYQPSIIPYWYYADDDSGTGKSFQPPLCRTPNCPIQYSIGYNSIQQQIEDYVEQNIVYCVNIDAYKNRVTIERGMPITIVDFGDVNTITTLYWEYNISLKGQTDKLDKFISIHNVNIPKMYKLAGLIVGNEKYGNTFSKQTMSMITLYSGLNAELPPIYAVDYSAIGGNQMWVSMNVKDYIKNNIIPLDQLYQVKFTNNYEPYSYDSEEIYANGIYKGFELGFGDSEEEAKTLTDGLTVDFIDPFVEPQITINEGSQVIKGEKIVKPADLLLRLMGIGITRFKTVYSVSYPILFDVYDPKAFNDEGFSFYSAFEVNIKNNDPSTIPFENNNDNIPLTSADSQGISLYKEDEVPFTVTVLDEMSGLPIRDAIVTYNCVEDFFLGVTDFEGEVYGKIPYCDIGGSFDVFQINYSHKSIAYDHDGNNHKLTIKLWEIKHKSSQILKTVIPTNDYSLFDDYVPNTINLDFDKDFVMLIIEPLDTDWPPVQIINFGNSSFSDQSVDNIYQNTQDSEVLNDFKAKNPDIEINHKYDNQLLTNDSNKTIDIVPGKYKITGLMLHTKNIHINEDHVGGFLGIGDSELPEQDFTTWTKGGLFWEGELTEENVYEDNVMNFIMEEVTIPHNWDMINSGLHVFTEEKQNNAIARIKFEK